MRVSANSGFRFRVDEETVRSAFTREERKKYFVRAQTAEIQWADDEILDSLHRAGALCSPLSKSDYEQIRSAGDFDRPSSSLVINRFGSWSAACQRAGVRAGQQSRWNYSSKCTDEELLWWIAEGLQRGHRTGTAAGMQKWLKTQPGAPSLATVRNRLGAWNQIKTDALRTIARRDVF